MIEFYLPVIIFIILLVANLVVSIVQVHYDKKLLRVQHKLDLNALYKACGRGYVDTDNVIKGREKGGY